MRYDYQRLGQTWRYDLENRRYGFLLCDNPISYPHRHPYFELSYVLRGEMQHDFMGTRYHLKQGDYYFVDIGKSHSYRASSDILLLNFMFYPEAIDPSYKQLKSLSKIVNGPTFRFTADRIPLLNRPGFHDENGSLLNHLEKIQLEIQEKRPGHHQMIHLLILQLIILLMRIDNAKFEETTQNQPIIQKILDLLNAKYAENLTLADISRQLGYSTAHISRLFKQNLKASYTEYLQRLRLAKSCQLLLSTDLSVEEIALAVGYRNLSFYHRLFQRYYGMTPLQYRKNG